MRHNTSARESRCATGMKKTPYWVFICLLVICYPRPGGIACFPKWAYVSLTIKVLWCLKDTQNNWVVTEQTALPPGCRLWVLERLAGITLSLFGHHPLGCSRGILGPVVLMQTTSTDDFATAPRAPPQPPASPPPRSTSHAGALRDHVQLLPLDGLNHSVVQDLAEHQNRGTHSLSPPPPSLSLCR